MNTNQLIDKILDKWAVKIICFVIAIFIYIFYQSSIYEKKVLIVPLQIAENGASVAVGDIPRSASIMIKAKKEDITAIHVADITAVVNLDNIVEPGNYQVPVRLSLSEPVLAMDSLEVRVVPEKIDVKVENKILKYVEIEPSIVGEVAKGYKIDSVSVNPSTVDVYGSESLVNATKSIPTTRVNVSNAEKSFTVEAEYQPVNKLIKIGNTGPYRVTVSIVQNVIEKMITEIPVTVLHLSDSLTISSEIPEISVKVKGNELYLDKFVPSKNFACINCCEITEPGTYELSVVYTVPGGMIMEEKEVETITIIVEKKTESPDKLENEETELTEAAV